MLASPNPPFAPRAAALLSVLAAFGLPAAAQPAAPDIATLTATDVDTAFDDGSFRILMGYAASEEHAAVLAVRRGDPHQDDLSHFISGMSGHQRLVKQFFNLRAHLGDVFRRMKRIAF